MRLERRRRVLSERLCVWGELHGERQWGCDGRERGQDRRQCGCTCLSGGGFAGASVGLVRGRWALWCLGRGVGKVVGFVSRGLGRVWTWERALEFECEELRWR